jgi:hypothetical protein
MTDAEVKSFLKESGYPDHLVKGGKKGIIARWEKFVDEVERGYSLNLEDYRNDLDLRAIISRLGEQAEVEGADARFRRMLIFTEESIWECEDNPDAFWLYGYPRNAHGDLLDDLRSEGFVE